MYYRIIKTLIAFCLLAGCSQVSASDGVPVVTSDPTQQAREVIEIPLQGPIAEPGAELSGLAWYRGDLVFLPQYPERFGVGSEGVLFKLDKRLLVEYLDGKNRQPLVPTEIRVKGLDHVHSLAGYEGFEAVAFNRDLVFFTVETSGGFIGEYSAYLVRGRVENGLNGISLDDASPVQVPSQVNLRNSTDESILIHGQSVISIHEANGAGINPDPFANQYDYDLNYQGQIHFPPIDYRVTDASQPTGQGVFWAINYFFPGDTHLIDPAIQHPPTEPIERILEFIIDQDEIRVGEAAPIELSTSEEGPRNWEGIVRFEDRGFLLVTDKHPRTIFAYVEYP